MCSPRAVRTASRLLCLLLLLFGGFQYGVEQPHFSGCVFRVSGSRVSVWGCAAACFPRAFLTASRCLCSASSASYDSGGFHCYLSQVDGGSALVLGRSTHTTFISVGSALLSASSSFTPSGPAVVVQLCSRNAPSCSMLPSRRPDRLSPSLLCLLRLLRVRVQGVCVCECV